MLSDAFQWQPGHGSGRGSYSRAPVLAGNPCRMQCRAAGPNPPWAFLPRWALHLQASPPGRGSPAGGLSPRVSAFPAGWSGWRKHRKLPLLPAPLHGAVAQRGQVQRHYGGHDQVRRHCGPALCSAPPVSAFLPLPHTAASVPPREGRGDPHCPSRPGVQALGQHGAPATCQSVQGTGTPCSVEFKAA